MVFDIIVCGHLTLDIIPNLQMLAPHNLIDAGKLFDIGTMDMSTGGAVSNTGLALHRLGSNVALMGLVGDDWIGQVILDFLRKHDKSLADYIQVVPSASSAYTIVIEPQNHDRTLLTHTGTNHLFGLDTLNMDIIQRAKIFHLGYPTLLPHLYQNNGNELLAIFQTVKQDLGKITSLDMTLPDANHPSGQVDWRAILSRLLPSVDIFIPSIEEILFMVRREDYEQWHGDVMPHMTADYLSHLANDLIAMGCAIVGFKLGERGLYIQTTDDISRLSFLTAIGQSPQIWVNAQVQQPAFKVDVMGTTGAGDATYAGFLSAMIRSLDVEYCATMACAVGACNVEATDPTSGVKSWDEILQRIELGWEMREK